MASAHQALLPAGWAGEADVHAQGLLPQCTVGHLHPEDLAELQQVVRGGGAGAEQTAGRLRARQQGQSHVPAEGRGGERANQKLAQSATNRTAVKTSVYRESH